MQNRKLNKKEVTIQTLDRWKLSQAIAHSMRLASMSELSDDRRVGLDPSLWQDTQYAFNKNRGHRD